MPSHAQRCVSVLIVSVRVTWVLLPSSDVRIVLFVIGSEAGDVVGFGEGGGNVSASEGVKSDDHLEFVRDSMLLGAGCGSISAIVAEQYDVERSIAVAPAAEASECEPLSVGFFSDDDF